MLNIDQLLTVILVIRDRPNYTFRWMDYANQTHFPFKILVADGGQDLAVETQLKDCTHYPNLNYTYLRYPYDANIKAYLCKISNALSQVQTPYVILADDDDFWNVDGIYESIKFLENHSDYATCRGQNFTFSQNAKDIIKTTYSPHTIFDTTQELPSERVLSIYPHFGGTFYDVHRSVQYQAIFKKITALDFHLMPMIEVIISLLDAANGKIKQLPVIYLMREDGHSQSTSRSGSYLTRLLTGPCFEQLVALCRTVAESVATHENISIDHFSEQLHNAFIAHLAPVLSNHLYAYHDIPPSRVAQNLKTWMIHFLERKYSTLAKPVRAMSHYRRMKKIKKAYQNHIKNNSDGSSVFQNINDFLQKHSEFS